MYVGGLDEKVSEPLLWELFLQAGPVVNTHMPKDRVTGQHQGEQLFYKVNTEKAFATGNRFFVNLQKHLLKLNINILFILRVWLCGVPQRRGC